MLVVAGGLDTGRLGGTLGKLSVVATPDITPEPFTLLDCFDQSLRRRGMVLVEFADRLILLDAAATIRSQAAGRCGDFVSDLQDGPVREALGAVSPLRALLVRASGRVATGEVRLEDHLQKTRARARFWTFETGQGTATLVVAQPLRGYAPAHARLCTWLRDLGGTAGNADDLYRLLFRDLAHYTAKPAIGFGPDECVHDVATTIMRTYLGVARANENGIIADHDTEFLHDYRIALRKIRSVISLFKGVFSDTQTARLKQAFSDLMAPTGRLRDLDVYLLERQEYFDLLPVELHPGLDLMFGHYQTDRADALQTLIRHLRSPDYDSAMDGLATLLAREGGPERGPEAADRAIDLGRRLIWKRYRKLCRIARRIDDSTRDEEVHELRITCKKLRYLMEFFAPLFAPAEIKRLIKPLKKLQDNLGLFNDYSVQQGALATFMANHPPGTRDGDLQIAQSVGGLIATLHLRQRAERARVMDTFAAFDSDKTRRRFRALFAGGDG